MGVESFGLLLTRGRLHRLVALVALAAVLLSPAQVASDSSETPAGTARGAFAALSAGFDHTCGIVVGGDVKCWGLNEYGQLGLGDTENRGDDPGEMANLPVVDLGSGRTATAIAAGEHHTCALLDDATVKCWGHNLSGGLGYEDGDDRGDEPGEMGDSLEAVDLGTGRTATAITAGSYFTCALLDDGSVKCWGGNSSGQLGYGDTDGRGKNLNEMGDALPVVDLGAGRTAAAIAAGGDHTCALLDDLSVKCWGKNSLGQLGQGDTDYRGDNPGEMGDALPVVDLGSERTAAAISVGPSHSCALLDNGTVKCWGRNSSGELGLGDAQRRGDGAGEMGDSLPAVELGSGRSAAAVMTGMDYTCALLDDASVKCWGAGGFGQLGNADTVMRGNDSGDMGDSLPSVNLGLGRSASAVVAGAFHTCALLDDLSVKCWGKNASGQLGLDDTNNRGDEGYEMGDELPVVNLGSGRTSSAISAGKIHSCVVLDDGAVKCWGRGVLLGLGDDVDRGLDISDMGDALSEVDLGTGRTATALAAGMDHTCALLDDATVKCWGSNAHGQIGTGSGGLVGDHPTDMGDALPVVDLGLGRTATAITSGEWHSCALLDDGTVKCWGSNYQGQLGLGDTSDRGDQPGEMGDALPAVDLGSGRTATAITAGDVHTCALLDDGTVKCWGYGGAVLGIGEGGNRGDQPGEMGDALPSVDLGAGRTVSEVRTGRRHTCALLDDGTVKCWGSNEYGQLGSGSDAGVGDQLSEMGDALPIVDLGLGRTATAITAGEGHTCAVLDDGTLKCWGYNENAQLGIGDTSNRGDQPGEMGDSLPAIDLGADRTASAVSAGYRHTCALLDDGTVKCWGSNSYGRLGIGVPESEQIGDESEGMGDRLHVIEGVEIASLGSSPARPDAPTVSLSDTTASVSWNSPGDDGGSSVTGFVLEASSDGTSWTVVASPSQTSFEVTGLEYGEAVQFRVSALNSVGASPPSTGSAAVTPTTTTTTVPPTTTTTTTTVPPTTTTTTTTAPPTTTTTTVPPPPPVTTTTVAPTTTTTTTVPPTTTTTTTVPPTTTTTTTVVVAPPSTSVRFVHSFVDVPIDGWRGEAVSWMQASGVTRGCSASEFCPDAQMTREQQLTFLYRYAGSPDPGPSHPFTDVSGGRYYSDAVSWAWNAGVTTGVSSTSFGTGLAVTRGQAVTFLWRQAGSPPPVGRNPFTDVAGGRYYSDAVIWAFEQGVTTGMSPVMFGPDFPVTRVQFAAFLSRFDKLGLN